MICVSGAYRMRGIGVGQRIVLLVIPGLRGLIARECSAAKPVSASVKSLQESLHPDMEKPKGFSFLAVLFLIFFSRICVCRNQMLADGHKRMACGQ